MYTVSGPALYKLCYAIKLVVEQGPLDFVTHHAKCTLSQDRLLSENVEYKELHVEAEGPDGVKSRNRISVLDCDTITQVKGKVSTGVFRNTLYRPTCLHNSYILLVEALWTLKYIQR